MRGEPRNLFRSVKPVICPELFGVSLYLYMIIFWIDILPESPSWSETDPKLEFRLRIVWYAAQEPRYESGLIPRSCHIWQISMECCLETQRNFTSRLLPAVRSASRCAGRVKTPTLFRKITLSWGSIRHTSWETSHSVEIYYRNQPKQTIVRECTGKQMRPFIIINKTLPLHCNFSRFFFTYV